jgi:hypothetical protein
MRATGKKPNVWNRWQRTPRPDRVSATVRVLQRVAANAQAGRRVGDGAGPATGGRERPGRTACWRWCGSCAAQAAALLPLAGRLTIFNCRGFVAPVLTRLEGSAAGGCAGRGPGPPGALAGERAPRTAVITKTFFVTKDPCLLPASNLRDHANCQWAIVRRHAGGPPVSATVENSADVDTVGTGAG